MVEVIREDVLRHRGDDLGDLTFAIAGLTDVSQVVITDPAALDNDLSCELKRRFGLGITAEALEVGREFVGLDAELRADRGVGRGAVPAGVLAGNGEGDLLAKLRADAGAAQCFAEAEVGFERGRRLSHGGHDVGCDAQGLVYALE